MSIMGDVIINSNKAFKRIAGINWGGFYNSRAARTAIDVARSLATDSKTGMGTAKFLVPTIGLAALGAASGAAYSNYTGDGMQNRDVLRGAAAGVLFGLGRHVYKNPMVRTAARDMYAAGRSGASGLAGRMSNKAAAYERLARMRQGAPYRSNKAWLQGLM